MNLVDAMIMSSKRATIVSKHSKRKFEPEQLSAKQLGSSSVVFDSSSGVTEREKGGFWSLL